MNRQISLTLALAAGYLNHPAMAQLQQAPPDPLPQFEAAWVQPSPPLDVPLRQVRMPVIFRLHGGPGTSEPGQLTCNRCSLDFLTSLAYEKTYAAITEPNWMYYETYDLIAKIPRDSTRHEVSLMLQQLLIERFGFVVHHVDRQLPGYVLAVGKQTPKLRPVDDASEASASNDRGLDPNFEDCLFKITAHGKSMRQLADVLSREVNVPVVDRTGLTGRYDFSVAWYPFEALAGQGRCTPGHVVAGRDPIDAVKHQLGLKVELRKLPGDALVVDSAKEVPTGN